MRRKKKSKEKSNVYFLEVGNRLLIVVIIGLLGHGLLKYFSVDQNTSKIFSDSRVSLQAASSDEVMLFNPKPFVLYAQRIQGRDIFKPLRETLKPDRKALEKALPALHKRVKLIGILLDQDSKAIVLDLKENQTHFLSKGESIGMAFLEDIQEDKVIFMYNNQRVEMAP